MEASQQLSSLACEQYLQITWKSKNLSSTAVTELMHRCCVSWCDFTLCVCRKSFCGYARVDTDLNYTTHVDHDEDAISDNEGMLSQLCLLFY